MGEIEEVFKGITTMTRANQTIASAVEEQSVVINDISKNIMGISTKSGAVSDNVEESVKGLADVAGSISGFNLSLNQITGRMGEVGANTNQLSSLAGNLTDSIKRFKV